MPTYTMTNATTLTVTFTPDEAAILARSLSRFQGDVNTVLAALREKYDAEDRSRLLNLFSPANAAKRQSVFTLLEQA